MTDGIRQSRVRPSKATIRVDAAIASCYRKMRWGVKLAMLRQELEARFGADQVLFHTTSADGVWVGKGMVMAEFRYAAISETDRARVRYEVRP